MGVIKKNKKNIFMFCGVTKKYMEVKKELANMFGSPHINASLQANPHNFKKM